jgi:hypothetical protein
MTETNNTTRNLKTQKQLRLDDLPNTPTKGTNKTPKQIQQKQITINEIGAITKEDELALKIVFKLSPSKTAFPKVNMDLSFDNQQVNSVLIRIPQGPLAQDEFELTPVLDMKGIPPGSYNIKVEMYELWTDGNKLSYVSEEIKIDYSPVRKEDRLIKVPTVTSFAGTDLEIVLDSQRDFYQELQKDAAKESIGMRDEW